MKKIILSLLIIAPLMLMAQRSSTEDFGKFTNAEGAAIKGSSLARGFERQIEVDNLVAASTNNNTSLSFSMPAGAATNEFRNALNNGKKLKSGEIVVTVLSADRRITKHKINMEDITVLSCEDKNGNTLLTLDATRIGWTYYTSDRSGKQTISSKSGWDAAKKQAWTGF
ncbi:type VI secretion system tube protein Hcp [Terrimonas sp. NA20]|uniref:Type VI secretion system tube protein Hcp n=1 Tax=Terrimonas ginsenosidimutans TaxID=2908004 RepID=A0ABS9L087_9BACT|nr:type VI secretion system tube protein Hcp [Terrimonas ginsenosidimutans]MCG2618010.1 type VI secretion system tube protein Hcp [Terrimonas ginsenosidimutans]